MALKGNLHDFSTTQLLNLIHLARKTGCLTVRTSSEAARLYFRDGKLIHAHTASHDGHLATMLVKAGKLTAEQAQKIMTRPEGRNDVQLGMLLIKAGHVSREDIIHSARHYMLDIVYTLFGWYDGEFEFTPDALPSADRILVPINLEQVILEGSRRLQEHERLQDELPDLDHTALRFTNGADARLRTVNLTVEEWRVISFVSPRNTIRVIAQANNMDDFQVRKIVYGLMQAGIVELVRPSGQPAVAGAPGKPGAEPPPAIKRSLIERLINRIKRI
ncbi:MAG: hypothetical protein DDG58_01030 [Ardenticatenia bacterium]|jgi:hypothetical protein|nr:MAG: hypothetical protein DDG58_01030 [Ardenticatenia bacterium]